MLSNRMEACQMRVREGSRWWMRARARVTFVCGASWGGRGRMWTIHLRVDNLLAAACRHQLHLPTVERHVILSSQLRAPHRLPRARGCKSEPLPASHDMKLSSISEPLTSKRACTTCCPGWLMGMVTVPPCEPSRSTLVRSSRILLSACRRYHVSTGHTQWLQAR